MKVKKQLSFKSFLLSEDSNTQFKIEDTPHKPSSVLVCAELLQSCLILCDPVDCSPPGSSLCGVLQARVLEWVAMPSSRGPAKLGVDPESLMSPTSSGGFLTTSATWKAQFSTRHSLNVTVGGLLGTVKMVMLCLLPEE